MTVPVSLRSVLFYFLVVLSPSVTPIGRRTSPANSASHFVVVSSASNSFVASSAASSADDSAASHEIDQNARLFGLSGQLR